MSELIIPDHWAGEKLLEVTERITKGTTPTTNGYSFQNKGISFVKIENVKNGRIDNSSISQFISKEANDAQKRSELQEGDILYSIAGTIGETCKVQNTDLPANCNQALAIIRGANKIFDLDFLQYQLKSPSFFEFSNKLKRGGAIKNISLEDISNFNVAIPPKGEQERIVQKIESCFQKIDKTEKALNEVEALLTKYRESLLAKAFRGELIPQDPKDEPASKLLEKIRAERTKSSNGKKVQEFAPIPDDEKPFDLPKGWEWVRLGEICSLITDGTHQTPTYANSGVIFLSSRNVTSGKIDWDKIKYIPEKLHQELSKRISPKFNDILLAKNGTTGVAAIVDRHDVFDIYVSLALIRICDGIDPHYILRIINSPLLKAQFNKRLKGVGVPNLHLGEIREVLIPLPPQKEQIRLIKKVDLLSNQFSILPKALEAKKFAIKRMREAILSKAFDGLLVSRIDSEGTGQELLSRIRHIKNELNLDSEIKTSKLKSKKITKKKVKK